ncbi:formiminoglutamate deiminase [Arthrobacter sp. CAN_A212]|uniref:formimidoylglutamate deiminase n=1 Tax=unclassified Arthrobacter TaxID=235627 RepID=UPI0018CA6009|nr:formimidoylglutamate deiminase [Arthrobacter sp. CAN_C5]MBP2217665.1 formiminoglutamate deiminase [Arthrobacter sp. CAN_C5]
MTTFWCEQAWVAGQGIQPRVRIEADDAGSIAGVTCDVDAAPGDNRDLAGVVFPAAANAHSHAFHRVLRGRTHDNGGDFWVWREEMYRAAGTLTPGNYERLATAVFAEMVVTGWSSVAEFHYVHHRPGGAPYGAPDERPHAMELALCRAAVAAGIRLTLLDTCYLVGGIGKPLSADQERFGDAHAGAWLERFADLRRTVAAQFDPGFVTVGAALHSVRAVPETALRLLAAGLPTDVPVHIHLSEQPAENADCEKHYGTTPTGLLQKVGFLSDRLSVVHATHLTDQDIALLGGSGTTAVICPTTEADLADGIGPARALQDAGARIALGTDQHAVIDPWLEMRALEQGERLGSGQRGRFSPASLLDAATTGAARAMATPVAAIEIGRPCDLVSVNPMSLRTAGSTPGQLPLTATAADVGAVVVAGHLVARDGHHHALGDPGALLAAALEGHA